MTEWSGGYNQWQQLYIPDAHRLAMWSGIMYIGSLIGKMFAAVQCLVCFVK